ncbi:ABC transporter substrate-binding protein [Paenibacillus daejeonensis]|uniref:ABC transporter substrate-binding protein n=1 Tax=Paenibacillus daejeonensis TaxID=135193 RepID=UPI00037ED78D|nr:extracellular solute-binding protein [Paenibacillus daejeonensis]
MKQLKRSIGTLFMLGWISMVTAGCFGGSDTEPPTVQENEADPVLRVLYAAAEAGSEAVISAAEEYERVTGVRVEVNAFPYNSLQERVFSELARESGYYDLIAIDTPWIPRIIQHLEPLSQYIPAWKRFDMEDYIAKLFLDTSVFNEQNPQQAPPVMDPVKLDDITAAGFDIWSFPIQSNVLVVSYRKDLFDDETNRTQFRNRFNRELTIPDTLDEYLDIARFFTTELSDDGQRIYGTTLMSAKHESNFVDFKSFLSVYGGRLLNDDNEPVFHQEEGVQALEAYGSWIHDFRVTPPDVLSYTWDEVEIAFGFGQVAMGMNYHDMRLNPQVNGTVGYFMMPGMLHDGELVRGPHFGSWGLAVNRYSERKQSAFELAEYLTSSAVQKKYLRFRQHVTRKSAYEAAQLLEDASQREYYRVLGESLSVGVGRPRTIHYDQLSEAIQTAVQQYLSFTKDARTALSEAAEEIRQLEDTPVH